MKNIVKIIFAAIVVTALSGGIASAQTLKIATVNIGKVFTNYYKTQLAQASLKDEQSRILKEENDMMDNLKKGDSEYKSLLDAASDQALSAEERDKNKKAAAAKLKELQETKADLDEYDRSAKVRLSDELQRMHDNILAEIHAAVNAKARDGGYNMVFDSSAQSVSGSSVLVFNSGQADLTDAVIKQLNIGAPLNWNATTPASPVPSLVSTNAP